jgi:filamentous hemagglutinin family protein
MISGVLPKQTHWTISCSNCIDTFPSTERKMMKNNTRKLSIPSHLLLVINCIFCPSLLGEVTLDGTLGTAGPLAGPNYQITENLGQRAGGNLFHSFGRFNLNNAESATFSGSAGIQNVIGRVTGGQSSNIDGAIHSTVPGANLYLLNPAGIIFGKNASLNVPGSFHASTANYLGFKDNVHFDNSIATPNPVLTTAAPEAFGFLGENPADISLTGGQNTVLEIANGKTLSLIGGDINIKNVSLYAPGGQVNLASVGSIGEVGISESELDTASFEKMGHINISQGTRIPRVTVGQNVTIANIDVSADKAGKVFIRGGQMVMENVKIESNTVNGEGVGIDIGLKDNLNIKGMPETPGIEPTSQASIFTSTLGKGNASDIVFDVDGLIKLTSGAQIISLSGSSGNAGDLIMNANTIILEGNDSTANPQIITGALKTGHAGNIVLSVTDRLNVSDGAVIASTTSSEGNAGAITIKTNSLNISQSTIKTSTSDSGKAGNININASDTISLTGPFGGILNQTNGSGNSGNIMISSDKLDVRNGISIMASTGSSSNSGDLFINSREIMLTNDEILLRKRADGTIIGTLSTGISAQIIDAERNEIATGNSGTIKVKADNLIISNGAEITTSNIGQGNSGNLFVDADKILLTTNLDLDLEQEQGPDVVLNRGGIKANPNLLINAPGRSGNITVNAHDLVVENGTDISTSNGTAGTSGDLVVNSDNIILSRNGNSQRTGILNTNHKTGKLGILTVNTENLQILNGAEISAATRGEGNGGNLDIKSKLIVVSGADSNISTQTLLKTGDAGHLTINTDRLEMSDGAKIDTSTFGFGLGGKLSVNSKSILLSGDGTGFSTRSGKTSTRNAGDLTITTDTLDMYAGASIDTSTQSQGVNSYVDFINANPDIFRNIDLTTLPLDEFRNSIGKGGGLTLNVGHLNIRESAVINAATFGNGDGGNLVVNAQTVFIEGQPNMFTGISSQANGGGTGNAGDLIISTDSLEIRDDARISASTFGIGQAGNLIIDADNILLHNAELQSASFLKNIDISKNSGKAMSGNVEITVNNKLHLENKGSISVRTEKANAGMIKINGGGILNLSDGSHIQTDVADGKGNGGNISIDTPIVALNTSKIIANAASGQGGNINISGLVIESPGSKITASSKLGMDGVVNLNPVTNINSSISILPSTFVNTTNQLSERCAARTGANLSSLVIKGRGGIPTKPGELTPSDFLDDTTIDETLSQDPEINRDTIYAGIDNSIPYSAMRDDCSQHY